MATYQTMILVGPAVLLLCAAPTTGPAASGVSVGRDQALRVIGLLAGSAAGVVGIYGWAYTRQGIIGFGALLQRFLMVDGGKESTEDSQSVKQSILRLGWSETSSMLILQTTQVSDGCCNHEPMRGWAVWLLVLLLANVVGAVVLAGLVWRHWGNSVVPSVFRSPPLR